MIVNSNTLQALQTSFNTLFTSAFAKIVPMWTTIAMLVPSSTAANDYRWLGEIGTLREWLGDKVTNNFAANGYYLENKDYELTHSVKRNQIEDDQIGLFNTIFSSQGDAAAKHPDVLVWGSLIEGFTVGRCFDNELMFSVAHPVNGRDATDGTYANRPAVLGVGEPWFLVDDSRPVLPMIFQKRKDYTFVSQTSPDSPDVFNRGEFKFGVEARVAAGYGLPQLVYGSREPLTPATYESARLAMSGLKNISGEPLGVEPLKLIVGEANLKAANMITKNENDAAGATNPWKGLSESIKVSYLTGQ